MKFLFASDSFKGSLSSERTAQLLEQSAKKYFPDAVCLKVSVADGGEGTAEAVVKAVGGEKVFVTVHDPYMNPIEAFYGVLHSEIAILDMSVASGLPLLPKEKRDPELTTSYGTGELIKAALDAGYRKIMIALGGSATNDGGMGAMAALGIRFLDENNEPLQGIGANLIKVKRVDTSQADPRIQEASFTVMCDVKNPLCGCRGATYTFGPQKGGTPEKLDSLETGMCSYQEVLKDYSRSEVSRIEGGGAAGGLGAALKIFLKAQMKSGIEEVLDLIGFDRMLEGVDLVVTGEGNLDFQSAYGKVISGIGRHCRQKNIPVVAVTGGMEDGCQSIEELGIRGIVTSINAPMDIEYAMKNAERLYANAADRLFGLIKAGVQIGEKR